VDRAVDVVVELLTHSLAQPAEPRENSS
jgi:hypothetical protein